MCANCAFEAKGEEKCFKNQEGRKRALKKATPKLGKERGCANNKNENKQACLEGVFPALISICHNTPTSAEYANQYFKCLL